MSVDIADYLDKNDPANDPFFAVELREFQEKSSRLLTIAMCEAGHAVAFHRLGVDIHSIIFDVLANKFAIRFSDHRSASSVIASARVGWGAMQRFGDSECAKTMKKRYFLRESEYIFAALAPHSPSERRHMVLRGRKMAQQIITEDEHTIRLVATFLMSRGSMARAELRGIFNWIDDLSKRST